MTRSRNMCPFPSAQDAALQDRFSPLNISDVVRALPKDPLKLINNKRTSTRRRSASPDYPARLAGIKDFVGSQPEGSDDIQYLVAWMLPVVPKYFTDKEGCCLVQRLIEKSDPNLRGQLLQAIRRRGTFIELSKSRNGNYPVQLLITKEKSENPEVNREVVEVLLEELTDLDIFLLAKHERASRVIERLIEADVSSHRWKALVAWAPELVVDEFGNYPIQRLMQMSPGCYRRKLFFALQKHLRNIFNEDGGARGSKFGRKFVGEMIAAFEHLKAHGDPLRIVRSWLKMLCNSHGTAFVEQVKQYHKEKGGAPQTLERYAVQGEPGSNLTVWSGNKPWCEFLDEEDGQLQEETLERYAMHVCKRKRDQSLFDTVPQRELHSCIGSEFSGLKIASSNLL